MLDKDKKIILFNFCPKKFGINGSFEEISDVYNHMYDTFKDGFDESIKLIGMIYLLENNFPPMFEIVDSQSRALKKKIKNYLDYANTVTNISELTQGDEYKELIKELEK